jgi:hypothetical protein
MNLISIYAGSSTVFTFNINCQSNTVHSCAQRFYFVEAYWPILLMNLTIFFIGVRYRYRLCIRPELEAPVYICIWLIINEINMENHETARLKKIL